jgi:5-formyltetrahydrofolate cyclo-ligase
MDEVTARKDAVRRMALLARSRVLDEHRAPASVAAARNVLGLPEVAAAASVLAFASFGAEMGTDPLLQSLLDAGKTVLLPYVEADATMRAAPISSLADLAPGYRGIREPPAARAPASFAQVAVVPGVAFDARGGRLGYGGGFYDRYLGAIAPGATVVGLCFDAQIVDEVPVEPHDRLVDVVVTEARVLRR